MIETIKTGSREEWLELRKKYIGGSDASAVVGMNPYRSAYALWAAKTLNSSARHTEDSAVSFICVLREKFLGA